jgi:predicted NodU family carbamoyl transferase
MKSKKIIASIYPFPCFIGAGHDTNFSLIKGNKIFSLEEGKLNAVVNSACDKFPEKSMLSGFKYFNIEPKDVDHWVFGGHGKTPKINKGCCFRYLEEIFIKNCNSKSLIKNFSKGTINKWF